MPRFAVFFLLLFSFFQVFWNETGVALAKALAEVLPGLRGGPLLLPNCEGGSACQKSDSSGSAVAGYNGVFEEFFGAGAGNETARGDQVRLGGVVG